LSQYIQKLKREQPNNNILIQEVSSTDAPISSEALTRINRSMTTEDQDYQPDTDDEEEEDGVRGLSGSMSNLSFGSGSRTPHCTTKTPTMGRGNSPREGGGNSLRGDSGNLSQGAGGVSP
jgi:hypothetical protein